jgi:hypothetical protein
MFNPFFNRKAWKNTFSILSIVKKKFATPYSRINFQYIFHQFASHFSSIELELTFHSIVELNLVEFQLELN